MKYLKESFLALIVLSYVDLGIAGTNEVVLNDAKRKELIIKIEKMEADNKHDYKEIEGKIQEDLDRILKKIDEISKEVGEVKEIYQQKSVSNLSQNATERTK